MDDEKKPFIVMVKPAGSRCNMRCSYCYYLDKGRYSAHERQSRMSYELLDNMIRQTIEASPGLEVSFVWHGGEPTLAGLDFYKKAVELERRYLPAGWTAWNNLQTNGFMLNDLWCRFLKDNHFSVGVSLDGCRKVHDKNRRDVKGSPTWEKIIKSIKRLRSFGIEPDILCTVNADSCKDPLAVYRAIKETGCTWCQFIPIVIKNEYDEESVTPEDYGRFLVEVFDEWVHHDLGKIDVQLFAEMARVMAGGTASLCWMSETCGRALIVEEDGAVYSCDHFVDNEHRLGNLATGDIENSHSHLHLYRGSVQETIQKKPSGDSCGYCIPNSTRRNINDDPGASLSSLECMANCDFQMSFGNAKRDSLTAECRSCEFLKYCWGACPKDRFALSSDGEPGQCYLCKGLKEFFTHAEPILKQVMDLSRAGYQSEEIMEKIRV